MRAVCIRINILTCDENRCKIEWGRQNISLKWNWCRLRGKLDVKTDEKLYWNKMKCADWLNITECQYFAAPNLYLDSWMFSGVYPVYHIWFNRLQSKICASCGVKSTRLSIDYRNNYGHIHSRNVVVLSRRQQWFRIWLS